MFVGRLRTSFVEAKASEKVWKNNKTVWVDLLTDEHVFAVLALEVASTKFPRQAIGDGLIVL